MLVQAGTPRSHQSQQRQQRQQRQPRRPIDERTQRKRNQKLQCRCGKVLDEKAAPDVCVSAGDVDVFVERLRPG
uniref:Uncharacterized protein n=1 Tax=Candidozyma auris TaxID=498019 RepID=A0A0L0NUT7_CANAR